MHRQLAAELAASSHGLAESARSPSRCSSSCSSRSSSWRCGSGRPPPQTAPVPRATDPKARRREHRRRPLSSTSKDGQDRLRDQVRHAVHLPGRPDRSSAAASTLHLRPQRPHVHGHEPRGERSSRPARSSKTAHFTGGGEADDERRHRGHGRRGHLRRGGGHAEGAGRRRVHARPHDGHAASARPTTRNRDVLWLLDQAHITVAAGRRRARARSTRPPSAAGMARADHYMQAARGTAHIDGRGARHRRRRDHDPPDRRQRARADAGAARQQPDDRRRRSGGPQSMSARDIDLTYADDGRTLQHAQLVENARRAAARRGQGGRHAGSPARPSTSAMAPDGTTVTNLNATENVQVDLPADGDTPAQADPLRDAHRRPARRARACRARPSPATSTIARRARRAATLAADRSRRRASQTLIVKTKPGFGALEQADFHGNVHFTDGPQVAADAPRALYHVDRDQIDLSPSGRSRTAGAARQRRPRHRRSARRSSSSLGTRKLKADTKVRSSMLPSRTGDRRTGAAAAAPPAGQPRPAHALPSLLKQDQPVNVTSNRLEYDGAAGHARLHRQRPALAGRHRRSTATRSSSTTRPAISRRPANVQHRDDAGRGRPEDGRAQAPTPTTGAAPRRSSTTTRSASRPTRPRRTSIGPQGDVTAEKLELFLKPTDQRARARGGLRRQRIGHRQGEPPDGHGRRG